MLEAGTDGIGFISQFRNEICAGFESKGIKIKKRHSFHIYIPVLFMYNIKESKGEKSRKVRLSAGNPVGCPADGFRGFSITAYLSQVFNSGQVLK